jgi:tetratricopeptide (TPR) repeat protein
MLNSDLAICMIAGNEERLISRALDAAFSVTPHVVVVRAIGGQTPDQTLEIARQRGCIVGEYHNSPATATWPFVDDFAAARNTAFRLGSDAVGPKGWLMWLDCDDTLSAGAGGAIATVIKDCAEEWILAAYSLPAHGKDVWRERIFRVGTAGWVNAVHEKCAPVLTAQAVADKREAITVRVCRAFSVIHEPIAEKSGSQERNINILRWKDEETQHIKFYLHYEYYLLGRREEAVQYGLEALRLGNLCGVYRYEVLMNLALLAEKNEHGQDMLQRAIKLSPDRREAHGLLALLQMDAGQAEEAVKTAEHLLTIPLPKITEWTHRPDAYGWKGYATLAWAKRMAGQDDEAAKIEAKMLEQGGSPRISLLHATRGRWAKATTMMNTWMSRAVDPFRVEHIFAIDEDDTESREKLARFRHIIVPAGGYSVAAWNAAAKAATGDVLVQMADDFLPPPDWDKGILDAIGGNVFAPTVLRVNDGLRKDGLITMAVVTRRWLEQEGTLFDPAFRNVYSDNDLTARAREAGAIIEAPHLLFEHQHPIAGKAETDATYERGNDPAEYARAEAIYKAKHT